ncbi:MAG: alpha/beta fold hydrolase [Cyanobacteria bacterium P01_D01_bin.44]
MKVILIHGLGRTPVSLWGLARHLQRQGFTTQQFGYAPFAETYENIVNRLVDTLKKQAKQGEYCIVAHSLGGIILRSALGLVSIHPPRHIVMLGPPNQPPRLAFYAWRVSLFRWFSRDCGLNLASPDFYAQLPPPPVPYTIIAGTKGPRGMLSPFDDDVNDGIVALKETRIAVTDRVIALPVIHTFMMNNSVVKSQVIEALSSIL